MKQKDKISGIIKSGLLLLALALPWSIGVQSFAAVTGLTICLNDLNTDSSGVEFSVYQVGTWNAGTERWEACSLDSSVSFNTLDTAADWEAAASVLVKKVSILTADYTGQTDQNGEIVFSDPGDGMYLVVQTSGQSTYGTISPFLASLPYMNEADGQLIHTLTVNPKAEKPASGKDEGNAGNGNNIGSNTGNSSNMGKSNNAGNGESSPAAGSVVSVSQGKTETVYNTSQSEENGKKTEEVLSDVKKNEEVTKENSKNEDALDEAMEGSKENSTPDNAEVREETENIEESILSGEEETSEDTVFSTAAVAVTATSSAAALGFAGWKVLKKRKL